MNSSSTSFENAVKEKDDLTGLLVVAVAVLGTLVAIGLLTGGVWACVVCGKILYRQRKWQKIQKYGIEGFPPQPREVVELGHISHPAHSSHHVPYGVNNTGISRNLGLCTSQLAEQLPALPAPKSWTPSPPFGYKKNHAPIGNTQYSSLILRKKKRPKRVRNVEINSLGKKCTPSKTHGNTLTYHPGYNTLASDMWSVQPGFSTSSSSHTSCSSRQSSEEAGRRTFRNTWKEKKHQTRWRESKVFDKELANRSRHGKRAYICVDSHQSNKFNNCRSTLDEGKEPPEACSSYRGSPQLKHHWTQLSLDQQQPRQSRAEASHHLNSYMNLSCIESSEGVHERRATNNSTYIRNVTPKIQRKTKEEKQEKSSYCRTYPTQSLTSTKSRRLWHESCGFKNEEPLEHNSAHASGPCWIHQFQTTQLQQRRADPLLHPLPHPHQEPYIMNEAREQEAFWRVARKYGFCETCGREKLHDQQHEAAWGDDRDLVQYSDWDQRCGSSLQDPTPSMSWDNLTLEPSPALANTESSKAAEGMNLAQYNEKMDNDIDTDDC